VVGAATAVVLSAAAWEAWTASAHQKPVFAVASLTLTVRPATPVVGDAEIEDALGTVVSLAYVTKYSALVEDSDRWGGYTHDS
jgi:hypothetical protein